jgi:molybdopterin-guanine dinucleotide biosynthesis protein A
MKDGSKNTEIAAVILAGGSARRLGGIHKGMIQFPDGISIIEKLLAELSQIGIEEVAISANDPITYQVFSKEIIPDLRKGVGPLAGIEAGMRHFADRFDSVMFLPCDLPSITAKQLLALKSAFLVKKAPAVFARTSEFFYHPLCAVVHNGLANNISDAIENGIRRPLKLWFQLAAYPVLFDSDVPFFNINNVQDYNKWHSSRSQSIGVQR